jgi:hypothetical protein
MKAINKFFLLLLAAGLVFAACTNPADDDGDGNGGGGDINWDNEPNGTLTIINNTSKDIIIFQGQTPTNSNILGGVRASITKTFDVEDDVSDFGVGGYMILRGVAKDDYEANKTNLSNARIEYSAMATYKEGQKFRSEISPQYTGDFGYKVTNIGNIGMELRKGSPDGEKIGYLPSLRTNELLYANSTNGFAVFPVYVYYSRSTGKVTTLTATSMFESVSVTPRPLANASAIQSYRFPNDQTVTWESIKGSLTSPVAYINITNNVPNQGAFFTVAGSNSLIAQNGYDAIGSGEQLTFEITSTVEGTTKNLVVSLYSGAVLVPVRFADATSYPTIKNGYDYTISINHNGGAVNDQNNYSASIVEGAKRDVSDDIISL